MGAFPLLKSGAIVQYPVTRTLEYSTRVLRFVDGTEQRFRQYGSGLHKWLVRLDLLDEEELLRLEQFFTSEQGRFGSFAFTDPWSGAEYANCSLESTATTRPARPGRCTARCCAAARCSSAAPVSSSAMAA